MPVLGYLEALDRFGLPELKQGDLQIKDGNIAVTADGDWQFGNTRINALFRHVERWRLNQPTRDELYAPMLITSQRRKDVLAARSQSVGASLVRNPVEFHEEKNPSPCRPARCSGYSLSDRMPDERVLNALRNACSLNAPPPGTLFHSDRGSQYASDDFREALGALGRVASMSRKGNCVNAVSASFFTSQALKHSGM